MCANYQLSARLPSADFDLGTGRACVSRGGYGRRDTCRPGGIGWAGFGLETLGKPKYMVE